MGVVTKKLDRYCFFASFFLLCAIFPHRNFIEHKVSCNEEVYSVKLLQFAGFVECRRALLPNKRHRHSRETRLRRGKVLPDISLTMITNVTGHHLLSSRGSIFADNRLFYLAVIIELKQALLRQGLQKVS